MQAALLSVEGRHEEALWHCSALQGALGPLPEAHPNLSMFHSCSGVVMYHAGQLPGAFHELVMAMVMRGGCPLQVGARPPA